MNVTCSGCGTKLKFQDSLAGKKGKCPKCGNIVDIPRTQSEPPKSAQGLATEPQKEYARSLGIAFPENISKKEMSRLISEAVNLQEEKQFARLNELADKESQAYQKMREEVLSEIDEEDCRLSKATLSQIVEELDNRDLGAILISFERDDVDISDIAGAKINVSFSDNLTETEMRAILVALGQAAIRQVSG